MVFAGMLGSSFKTEDGGGGGGTPTGQWYLYQNFGTDTFVDDGSHGSVVNTSYYSNALSYVYTTAGVPNNSYLGWTEIYSSSPASAPYNGRYYATYSDNFTFWGGAYDLLGYEFDVSGFQKVKIKFTTDNFAGSQNAVRVLDASSNVLIEEIIGGGATIEKEYDTSTASKFQIIEGWNQTIGILHLFWVLAYF